MMKNPVDYIEHFVSWDFAKDIDTSVIMFSHRDNNGITYVDKVIDLSNEQLTAIKVILDKQTQEGVITISK